MPMNNKSIPTTITKIITIPFNNSITACPHELNAIATNKGTITKIIPKIILAIEFIE